MRVIRVQELVKSHDWYNGTIVRENAPYGLEMHWTRVHDLCILAMAAPFVPFVGMDEAIHISASFIGTLFLLLILILVYDIGLAFSADVALVAGLQLFTALTLTRYVAFLRPDLHSLLIFLFVYMIREAVYFLRSSNFTHGKRLGILFGLSIWASPELIVMIALIMSFLLFCYWHEKNTKYLKCSFNASLIQSFIVFLLVFGLERPIGDFRIEYDRISIAHLGLSIAQSIFFKISLLFDKKVIVHKDRIKYTCLLAVALLLALCALFPKIYLLSFGSTDDYMKKNFLKKIIEMQPASYKPELMINTCFLFGISFFYFLTQKVNKIYLFFAYLCSIYYIFGALILRCLPYYEISTLIPNALFIIFLLEKISNKLSNKNLLHLARPLLLLATPCISIVLPHTYKKLTTNGQNTPHKKKFPYAALLKFLNENFPSPQVIAINFSHSPYILFFTKHSVLSGPYHRNKDGFIALTKIMDNKTDEKELLQIVKKRGINLVIRDQAFTRKLPSFIKALDLPEELKKRLYIYKINIPT